MKQIRKVAGFLISLLLILTLAPWEVHAESDSFSIEVNVTENVVTVFENGQPIKAMTCSSGAGSPQSGTYRTSAKYDWRALYGNVYGQYCTRITGHILFHSVPYTRYGDHSSLEYWEYDKLGTQASMGCIRLSVEDAKWIYDNCSLRTSVTFVTGNSIPLGKPETYKISNAPDGFRGWDPTDPAGDNPWRVAKSNSVFNADYYANRYEDLRNAYGNSLQKLLVHWVTYGIHEGRQASEEFDITYYKEANEDLRNAFGGDDYSYVYHYLEHGIAEGRRGIPEPIDPAYCEAFVRRLYEKCLGREADPEGLAHWQNLIMNHSQTCSSVMWKFVFSQEYNNKHVSDDEYVEMLYNVLLDRPSDAGGKENWLRVMSRGMSREYVFKKFTLSSEYAKICEYYGIPRGNIVLTQDRDMNEALTAYVNRMYTVTLGRNGEEEGLNHWCRTIRLRVRTPEQVAESFINSEEFRNKNLSDEEFVKVLYRAFMDREYDEAGLQHWLSELNSGCSRENIVHRFAGSPEFKEIQAKFGV